MRRGNPRSSAAGAVPSRRFRAFAAALVLLSAFVAMGPALRNGFVNWDDLFFITESAAGPLSWDMLGRICRGLYPHRAWYPVFHLSLAVDQALWPGGPAGFHLTNLLLHVGAALVVLRLGVRLLSEHTGLAPRQRLAAATTAAVLFAVHPVNVEPVAWVSGRKVLLGGLLMLLAFAACLKAEHGLRGRLAALFLFVLACMSHASAVALPLLILAHDVILRRRQWLRCLVSRLDFLAIAVAAAIFRYMRVEVERDPTGQVLGFWRKAQLVLAGLGAQFDSVLFPVRLSNFYWPRLGRWWLVSAGVFFIIGSVVAVFAARRRRFLVFALAWVWLALLPTIGVHLWRCDRHLYLPSIGLFWLVAIALSGVLSDGSRRCCVVTRVAALVVLLALVGIARYQSAIWQGPGTLWRNAVRLEPGSAIAHANLGTHRLVQGYPRLAAALLTRATNIHPAWAAAHFNLAAARLALGDLEAATACYTRAIESAPSRIGAYTKRARVQVARGDFDSALADLSTVIKLRPESADAWYNRGLVHALAGHREQGIADHMKALAIEPGLDAARAEIDRLKRLAPIP